MILTRQWDGCSFWAFCACAARPLPLMVADHLLVDNTKGHGRKAHGLFFLWSTGVLEHWSIGTAQLRICPSDSHPSGGFPVWECGLRNSNSVLDLVPVVFNPKSEI
jgi:hypothetical protein